TNSNFIWMPVLAVKSLDSSTKALAGSQAAQQSVSCLVCATAEPAIPIPRMTATAARVLRRLKRCISFLLTVMATTQRPGGALSRSRCREPQSGPAFAGPLGMRVFTEIDLQCRFGQRQRAAHVIDQVQRSEARR